MSQAVDKIITYTVRDKSGAIRTRGASEDEALALAQRLAHEADVPVACEVERVTYSATVEREVVAKFTPGGSEGTLVAEQVHHAIREAK